MQDNSSIQNSSLLQGGDGIFGITQYRVQFFDAVVEPEAAFGQIKYDRGFKRFRYRGGALISAEFATVAIAHNIRKMNSVMDAERSRLAVKSYTSKKKVTNNHLLVAFIFFEAVIR